MSVVFKSGKAGAGSSVNSLTIQLTGVSNGDSLFFFGGNFNDSVPVSSVVDDQGNIYTKVTNQNAGTATGGIQLHNADLWESDGVSAGGGTVNITANYGSPTNPLGIAFNYSAGLNSTLDQTNFHAQFFPGGGTITAGGITTLNANDVLLGIVWSNSIGGIGLTSTPPYTLEGNFQETGVTSSQFWIQDQTVGATGSYDSDGTITGNPAYCDVIVALALSGGGATLTATHSADVFVLIPPAVTHSADIFVDTTVRDAVVNFNSQCVNPGNQIDTNFFGCVSGNTFLVFILYSVLGVGVNPFTVEGDSFAETFSLLHGPDVDPGSSDTGLQIWGAEVVNSGGRTITVALPNSPSFIQAPFCVLVLEVEGLDNGQIFDKWAGDFGTGSDLDSGPTTLPTLDHELIVGYGGSASTQGSPTYTEQDGSINVSQAENGVISILGQAKIQTVKTIQEALALASVSQTFGWGMAVATFPFLVGAVETATHSADLFVKFPPEISHSADVYVFVEPGTTHSADVYVDSFFKGSSFINVDGKILFAIKPNAFLKVAGTVAQLQRPFINVLGTIKSAGNRVFLNVAGVVQTRVRNYVKVRGDISGALSQTHSADVVVSTGATNLAAIEVLGTIVGTPIIGRCGGFPDELYINVAGWIIEPGNTDSIQMPNQGFPRDFDWNASADAFARYKPGSLFKIQGSTLPPDGIALVVTAFTSGVASFQTRTRSWLRRVDEAPSGIVKSTKVTTHTLPNGAVVTTTTETTQNQDSVTTKTTTENSATPGRLSTIISTKNQSGQTVTREIDTVVSNGIITSVEKKNVKTSPPTNDNIQPLQVRTLDGVVHYQFFTSENKEWSGGDQEGLTTIDKSVDIIPGSLNGATTDSFGNLIYNQRTETTETDPTGKITNTVTEEIGTRRDIGTTTTDTEQKFNGIQTTTVKTVNYPDGSQDVTTTVSNPLTGDTVETDVETVTDEFGQVTITTTRTETTTTTVNGVPQQTINKTVTVNKGGVITVDTVTETNNDFEDDIISDKIKVYAINEFTLTCSIDEFNMEALAEINFTHQRNYALLELLGQQLGNANLSYKLRQTLIAQFDLANACIAPMVFTALGRQFKVVFAQSASAFRAKYIPGVEPHVYELQMILQARSDLTNGQFGG